MEYITAVEAAEKWGMSIRSLNYQLTGGYILGAVKKGKFWLIPAGAPRPADKRRRVRSPAHSLSGELTGVFAATSMPMPAHDPDAVLDAMESDRLRRACEADIAYLRGDFSRVLACFWHTEGDDAARLRICPAAIAAAISLGDYRTYTEIDAYLKRCAEVGGRVAAVAELSLATAAVSCIAPSMAPEWLAEGNLSALPPAARLNAIYLRAKYLNCVGRFEAMLSVAQTALSLCGAEESIVPQDIYLRLLCAVACVALGRRDEAKEWLLRAMRIGLPHGFITPFSEIVTALGGLMEQCLEQSFPEYRSAVLKQWKRVWRNWIAFHNQFTRDNITLILSLREYHIAVMIARRVPYAKVAEQYRISVGRLKNIMLGIYGKLGISGREELAGCVF